VSGLRKGLRLFVRVTYLPLVFAAFFWSAGRVDWVRGWSYLGLLTVGSAASHIYLVRHNPDVLKHRRGLGRGTKKWDLILLTFFAATFLGTMIVAALDERYGWSSMSGWFWLAGAIVYAVSLAGVTWAMAVNPHFEKTVRIQNDRGHRIIDTGPYRIVRHPGYSGTIVGFALPAPFLLGSWWAIVPAALLVACIVLRTALEDRTLQRELPGYAAFAKKTRYRLLPGVW
jgi:protein-S-isoprenylcysteine O-methyltransferase Ste14